MEGGQSYKQKKSLVLCYILDVQALPKLIKAEHNANFVRGFLTNEGTSFFS